jgi:hypothetical protein
VVLLGADGVTVTPPVIAAVVVSFVVSSVLPVPRALQTVSPRS